MGISSETIMKQALSTLELERGKALYEQGAVQGLTDNAFWKSEVEVRAIVQDGEEKDRDRLKVKIDQFYQYQCDCAEHKKYEGMCRHSIATALAYKNKTNKEKQPMVYTSSNVRTMIREYTNREVVQILALAEEKKIHLIPKIHIGRHKVSAEFRIGKDRYYVLKDLAAFGEAMSSKRLVEYGKNLAFHHDIDAFADDSAPMAELILELATAYRDSYQQFKGSLAASCPPLREVILNRANRDRLFSLLLNRELEVQGEGWIKNKVQLLELDPELDVWVEAKGSDGASVTIKQRLMVFHGERYLYVCDGQILYRCSEAYGKAMGVFLDEMVNTAGEGFQTVHVNGKDMPLFYERVLETITPYVKLHEKDLKVEDYKPEPLSAAFRFDSEHADEIVLHPQLRYGDYSFHPVEDVGIPKSVCRDVPGELRINQVISRYFKHKEAQQGDLVIRGDEEAMFNLLTYGLEEFMELGEVYLSEAFGRLKVVAPPKISIGVSVNGNWLDLNIDAGGMTGKELMELLSSYKQKKRYHRLSNGRFMELDSSGLEAIEELSGGLQISDKDLQKLEIQIPKYRAMYLDRIFREYEAVNPYRDSLFKTIVRGMREVEDSDYEIPSSLADTLRGYQKKGFRWLKSLDSCGFGGILADDMGLGKTIQIISLLLYENQHGEEGQTSIIICPASLIYNWENEFATFAPGLTVLAVAGTAEEREEKLKGAGGFDVIITSYDLLRRDLAFYEQMAFRFQVIDEAQYIKNAQTQNARAVKSLQSQSRFALTGTPIENKLSELWSIFDYLMPGFLFGYQKFKQQFETPIAKEQDEKAMNRLHRMIGPFVLRRLKQDVLKELPPKLENIVYSKLEPEQRNLYNANALELKQMLEGEDSGSRVPERFQVLARLTRLRQICCDPRLCYEDYRSGSAKLDTCMEMILDGLGGGHAILVFSQFSSMLELLGQRLTEEGIGYYLLTGSVSKENRLAMVNSFNQREVPLFLISLKAGGTGLNLTAADMVIHYDPWWNIAAQNQATDRAHRIGQKKVVSVFKLIAKDTVEENILKLQESKQNLATQIISEGMVSLSSLTKEDIIQMV